MYPYLVSDSPAQKCCSAILEAPFDDPKAYMVRSGRTTFMLAASVPASLKQIQPMSQTEEVVGRP